MSNILERLGVNVTGEQFRAKNVAAVIVTGQLHAFARAGGRIDVTVSAIGDASSLRGGTLVMTPLNAADGQIYAVAQGSIIAGGVAAEADAARTVQGVPTAGSIPSGAIVEREACMFPKPLVRLDGFLVLQCWRAQVHSTTSASLMRRSSFISKRLIFAFGRIVPDMKFISSAKAVCATSVLCRRVWARGSALRPTGIKADGITSVKTTAAATP